MTRDGCPLCGTPGHACGQPFTGTPFDLPRTETTVMGAVKRYRVIVNGTETVLKLTEKDAKNYDNAALVDGQNDATEDADTEADATSEPAEDADRTGEKAAKPANKSRTAQNKTRASGSASNT